MKQKRATSFEVAKRAGVSRTTVSFVLNGVDSANISEETRQRVLEAARELNYVPSAAARTLASGQTRTLGLIIHNPQHLLVDAFIPRVLYSLIEVSRERGFRVIVEAVEDVTQADTYLNLVRAKHIDGLAVLNPRADDSQLPSLIDEGFPVVIVGRIKHPKSHAVFFRSAAEGAVRHLLELGHERIAHISYAPFTYLSAKDRLTGYRRALRKAGIAFDEALVRAGDYSAESGYHAMRSLLAESLRPSAIFAGNDTIALGAMAAIHQAGLRIPEDVAVVGYDDLPIAPYMVPPLTTVRTSALKQGKLAGSMLIDLINGKAPPEREVRLATELIIRESCGAAGTR